jgi:transposase
MKSECNASAAAWIGIDVAKRNFDAALCVVDSQDDPRAFLNAPARTFPRTPHGCAELVTWVEQQVSDGPARATMEATGRYSTELAGWILEQRPAWSPAILQPTLAHNFIESLGLRNHTDRLAARGLARYGVERRPAAYRPPHPQYSKLRDLVRYRRTLVEQQTAEKNQAQEVTGTVAVSRMQNRRLRQIAKDITRIEADMRALVKKHPGLKDDVALLVSIAGMGFVVAVTLLGELGDLRRFASGRQLAAFAGLTPENIKSGDSVHPPTHLLKRGNAHARHILYLAAMAAIRGQNSFQRFYLRILAKHPDQPMIALAAVMRKMLVVARAILIHHTPYIAEWNPCGEPSAS